MRPPGGGLSLAELLDRTEPLPVHLCGPLRIATSQEVVPDEACRAGGLLMVSVATEQLQGPAPVLECCPAVAEKLRFSSVEEAQREAFSNYGAAWPGSVVEARPTSTGHVIDRRWLWWTEVSLPGGPIAKPPVTKARGSHTTRKASALASKCPIIRNGR